MGCSVRTEVTFVAVLKLYYNNTLSGLVCDSIETVLQQYEDSEGVVLVAVEIIHFDFVGITSSKK
jgi:hypothetical protein